MKLDGIKINFLGDSITEGHGTSGEDYTYWKILEREAGLLAARGYGIGGTRYARQHTPSDPRWDLDFCKRMEEMDPDADVIVIFGGTNDFGHGDAPLGQMSDRTPDTFYGACHYLYSGIINRYPKATTVIMTPLHRCNEDNPRGDGHKTENLAILAEYVAIIKEVAAYYALPVLDLFAVSGIQPKVEINRITYCPDGLHPNDEGQKLIASRLKGFLETL